MPDFSRLYNYFYLVKTSLWDYLRTFFSFFHIKLHCFFILLANLAAWFSVYYINRHVSQDLVVLHYNVDFGVNLIGSAKQLYTLPLIGTIVFLVNIIISIIFVRQDNFKFISQVLLITVLFTHFFLLTAIASLYLINFR